MKAFYPVFESLISFKFSRPILLLLSLLCVNAAFAWAGPSLESPQKLSPKAIQVKPVKVTPVAQVVSKKPLTEAIPLSEIQEKPMPLTQALKPDNTEAEQRQLLYGMLALLVVSLVGAWAVAKKAGMKPSEFMASLFVKTPLSLASKAERVAVGDSEAISNRTERVSSRGYNKAGLKEKSPFGNLLASIQQKSEPDESEFYRPNVVHRQRLGGGKELLTVQQAGQWLLLGVTPTQIQFLANLTDEVVKTEPSKLDDPELAGLYDKYVEPLVVKSEQSKNRADFMTAPAKATVSMETLSESELDETEFQLPDFEDVFDPLVTSSNRPLVSLSQQQPNYLV